MRNAFVSMSMGRFNWRATMGPLHPRGRFGVAQQTVQNGIVCGGQLEFSSLPIFITSMAILYTVSEAAQVFPGKISARFPDKTFLHPAC